MTLTTPFALTVPAPAGSTTAFCRSCGQVWPPTAGGDPPPCASCGTDRSVPADERHSRIGRTFTYRAGLTTRTGVAVAERGDVVVALDVNGNRLYEVESKRLRGAAGAETSPSTRCPTAASTSPTSTTPTASSTWR